MQSALIPVIRNLNYLFDSRLFIQLANSETRQDEFSWSVPHEKNETRDLTLALRMQQDLFLRATRSRKKGLDTFARECFDKTRKRSAGKWKSKGLPYAPVPYCRKDSSKASAETRTNWSRCRERTRWKSFCGSHVTRSLSNRTNSWSILSQSRPAWPEKRITIVGHGEIRTDCRSRIVLNTRRFTVAQQRQPSLFRISNIYVFVTEYFCTEFCTRWFQ